MRNFLEKLAIIFFILGLFSYSAYASQNHHDYYPLKFQRLLDGAKKYKDFDLTKAEQEMIRNELFLILSGHHQVVKNAPDKLGCSSSGNARCYIHSSLGYRGARKILFGKIHLEEDGRGYFVKDVYCRKDFTNKETNIGPNTIPNSNFCGKVIEEVSLFISKVSLANS